jgi:hypothetical protein
MDLEFVCLFVKMGYLVIKVHLAIVNVLLIVLMDILHKLTI